MFGRRSSSGRGFGRKGGLIVALVVAAIALFRYYSSSDFNEYTGETQYVNITEQQEIALGLQSAPQMMQQHGGLHPNREAQAFVDQVGQRLVEGSFGPSHPYPYEFHLLADEQTINAFALPGGQVFITAALFDQLETEDQLAGVFGHEIAHVVARHGAERIAQMELQQGLTGAAVMATYDPDNPASAGSAGVAAVIGNLLTMRHGRDQELESDRLGVRIMMAADYDPHALKDVMRILAQAGGSSRRPEFFSTHPNPDNRIQQIEEAIEYYEANGVD